MNDLEQRHKEMVYLQGEAMRLQDPGIQAQAEKMYTELKADICLACGLPDDQREATCPSCGLFNAPEIPATEVAAVIPAEQLPGPPDPAADASGRV